MMQHFAEVQKLVKHGKKSDSSAKHLAMQFNDTNPSPANQLGGITHIIFLQGNPISAVKNFATKTVPCVLKKELPFSNIPDPTNNFLSIPTMKSSVLADTDHASIGVQSRPPPALISQSMTKETDS